MGVHSVRGRNATHGSSAANRAVAVLHNLSSSRRVALLEFGVHRGTNVGARPGIFRFTDRGTAGSTVTPDADNDWSGDLSAPSGCVLDLGPFSSQPTAASPQLYGSQIATVTGSGGAGYVWVFDEPIIVPLGAGVGIRHADSNDWGASEFYAVWEEF